MGFRNVYHCTLSKFGLHERAITYLKSSTGNRILDVGCNEGYIGREVRGKEFFGIELSPENVEKAQSNGYQVISADLNTTNLSSLPLEKKSFDHILFLDILEHLIDPLQQLKQSAALLKDNGKILISLPNIANWRYRLMLLFGQFNYRDIGVLDRTHLHLYTKKSAKQLVTQAGLTLESIHFTNAVTGFITWRIPILGPLLATGIFMVVRTESQG
jgi:2-polyprenyl-3-methyl-5-hydroxy-6-metoxy-1,4-benzoquinol methylase